LWPRPGPYRAPALGKLLERLERGRIGDALFNSLFVTVGSLLLLLPIGAMAAYVLARYPFRGSRTLFAGFMGGMMFPNFLVIVPLFFLLNSLHLYDTSSA